MQSRWSDRDADEFLSHYAGAWGEDLALRTYTGQLLGRDRSLVLHGGGNTSVKTEAVNSFGEKVPAIFVKASGYDLATIKPGGHTGLELEPLQRLRKLGDVGDDALVKAVRTRLLDPCAPTPSIETPVHVLLAPKYIDHTHADAVLALTNQVDGRQLVQEALGDDVIVLDYVVPGLHLALESAAAITANPGKQAMVWMHHGVVTWGETAREAYERMIEAVSRAEQFLETRATRPLKVVVSTGAEEARQRYRSCAPVLRGILTRHTDDGSEQPRRVILAPLIKAAALNFVNSEQGWALALSPVLTADHLIRTRPLPLWIDDPAFDDPEKLRGQFEEGALGYVRDYEAYVQRHATQMPEGLTSFEPTPRVVMLPGLGCVCVGESVETACIVRDITEQTIGVKSTVATMGQYEGLGEEHLFAMEYRTLQHAKLAVEGADSFQGHVSIVTGAAGAIGSGICRVLLEQGSHVAVTDLPGERLDGCVEELRGQFGDRVIGVALDVTDPASVGGGFETVCATYGGVDLVVINAGDAHISSVEGMDLEAFRRLEQINTEGTLLLLSEAGRLFRRQACGGDVVLISTKNVFSPGARFGAYSATKAASHQLGRIASLEMADMDVRVNMVAPDAVFAEGERKSGLWQRVGPDRMRARGLDEAGLEEFYRSRNLLKARITATHVARAVLFFAMRQTPTTGATLPVDGGLPDATPR
jgi:rhamnose utilization protein RhaD (predicted bifunctional aldolase and dehydrogenase)/NAD(P)-dependent dehydrogenase (short-subunit alcohol dehydrogenase family)